MAAAAAVGGANILNDMNDIDIDKRTHPGRPIVSGRMDRSHARLFFIVLWTTAALTASLVSFRHHDPLPIIIVFFTIIFDISYENFFKSRGLFGNLIIGVLTGAIFLFGGSLWSPGPVLFFLVIMASISTASREIIKDVQDMDGERGTRKTLPLRIGARRTLYLSFFLIITAVLLGWGPIFFIGFDGFYVTFIGLADLIMISGAIISFKNSIMGQVTIKAGMLVAVIGFILSMLI